MCLFANRLSFSELFVHILPTLNVGRLCVAVDSLISAPRVCCHVSSAWRMVCEVLFNCGLAKLNSLCQAFI